ncbi:MAG: hypothetical protein J4N76_11375, partial [Chloroflexi bacterium]|nr:hypothetical protein [Chloroflexota bacterium]
PGMRRGEFHRRVAGLLRSGYSAQDLAAPAQGKTWMFRAGAEEIVYHSVRGWGPDPAARSIPARTSR